MGAKPTNAHWLDLEDAIHLIVEPSGTGDVVLKSAVTGKRLVVVAMSLVASAATVIQFKSGSTDITGPMSLGANAVFTPSPDYESGLFETAVGEALTIGQTVDGVDGWLVYKELDGS